MSGRPATASIEWLGSDRRPDAVAAALDRLAVEANDLESREAFQRGAEAIRGMPAPASPRRGGKRPGAGRPIKTAAAVDAALLAMLRHNLKRRERGLRDNDREAARTVSRRLVGNSDRAVVDRLRKKYREQKARLMMLVGWDLFKPL